MKKLLYVLLFLPTLVMAQATLPITIPSNLYLDTCKRPNNTPAPLYLTQRTYLNGGAINGDNGIPENRFYQMVVGTATGGSGNMPYSLAYQLANKYIIQRSGYYFTTLKVITHYDNVLALQDSVKAQYGLIKGMNVKVRADSTIAAINAERVRAIAVENTKEAAIAATSTADYFRGDKSMQNFVNAARSSSTPGAGISYIGGVIANTAPDQTVTIASGTGIAATGTYPNFTVSRSKRQETYSGSTNASGIYTATFGTAYAAAPNIQANIVGGTNTNLIKITSVSTTAFTVTVVNRVDVIGLLPTYANVNAAAIDVLITEK